MEKKSVFETLSAINCNGHTEKKNGLTYLAWAWAWQMVKKNYPNATYTIYEDKDGKFYHTDGVTCWVKTGVTIEGMEMVEYLPVMDFRNASIPKAKITSFDVNKAIQRSLTKACARHGLGLYIYAGEDLPEGEVETKEEGEKPAIAQKAAKTPSKASEGRKVNPKAAEVWKAYKALPAVMAMSDAERNADWQVLLKKTTGKVSAADINEVEWAKVMQAIAG